MRSDLDKVYWSNTATLFPDAEVQNVEKLLQRKEIRSVRNYIG